MAKWQKKEKRDARDFGGERIKGSGNQWYAPGDVSTDDLLIDSKATKHKSYSVKKETWDKLYEEALFSFKMPVLSLEIQDLELVVVSKEDFLDLIKTKD